MVRNYHSRALAVPPHVAGRLLNGLASADDLLWPAERWPAMHLEPGLRVGARGGHGPIRYMVELYVPGQQVRFRFQGPRGFDGYHEYLVEEDGRGGSLLRHRLVMVTHGAARLSWPALYRPLHDALIEDSLDKATTSLGLPLATEQRWSAYVRALRAVLSAARRGTHRGVRHQGRRAGERAGADRPMVGGG
jgi:hypothetical protein